MAQYLIFFNQAWVGDHSEEWFRGRGPLAKAVVDEMAAEGVLVFAGGLDEDLGTAFSADPTGAAVSFGVGPFADDPQYLGGLTIVDVPGEAEARRWAGKVAEACGWPQEVRRFMDWNPDA